MSDLISREAAIDALKRLQKEISGDYTELDPMVMAGCGYIGDCIGEIEDLPSAQPTQNTRVNSSNALDTISRQAAIDAMAKFVPYAIDDDVTRAYTDGLTDAYNLVCQLPSAQPELIRCKNCKHNQLPSTSGNANCEIFYGMTDQDGFCHMAERRTDDQT